MMKHKIVRATLGLAAAALFLASAQIASAANIYAQLAAAPQLLGPITASNPAEEGNWEYVYDIMMDNESQFDEFQLEGFDTTQIVNQHPFSHGSISGILTQKWDGYAASTGIKSWDQTAYGSYNSGGSWTIPGGYTGLGEGILNTWHAPGDYQGTSSWAGVDPKFVTPGHSVTSSAGVADNALRFVNSVTTGTLYTGLIVTVRIVHPNAPGSIDMRAYSFNGGGTVYTNSVTGPGAGGGSVPEPSTMAMLGMAMLGFIAVLRRRR